MKDRLVDRPILVISIDFELLWGAILHPEHEGVRLMANDDGAIARGMPLLRVLEKHAVPATWAVVGHLFLAHCDRKNGMPHAHMPRFSVGWYSCDPCTNLDAAPLYYAKDIVEAIVSSPVKHEIGYHSFSHVPFSDCSREVARAEIVEGIRLAGESGIALHSFVYPYNKVGHVDILLENGFKIYRGTNAASLEGRGSLAGILGAMLSKVVPPPVEPRWVDGIWEIPSSMSLLSPLEPIYPFHYKAGLGLLRAIRSGGVFHIFLHSQDFLYNAAHLERRFEQFLAFAANKRDAGELSIMTMGELARHLDERREAMI